MEPIQNENKIAGFQELLRNVTPERTCVGHSKMFDGNGIVHHHRSSGIVMPIAAQQLD